MKKQKKSTTKSRPRKRRGMLGIHKTKAAASAKEI
jgi:hypothetical protein